jgi:hypothetical protein
LEAAIEFIQQVPGYEENWELITIWAACLTHQEKLLDKTQERIKVVSKAIGLANKANDLHVAKLSKEHPFMCELVSKHFYFTCSCTNNMCIGYSLLDFL